MKLKQLTLKNFRGFKHFECEFQPGINVLVGLNGYGKTSLLDAIAVAYGPFLSGFGTSTDRLIRDQDIHLSREGVENVGFSMESQFPVEVNAHVYFDDQYLFPSQWSRARNSLKSTGTKVKELTDVAKALEKMVQDGEMPTLPMMAYYGTDRLWTQNFEPSIKPPKMSRLSRLQAYSDWFKPRASYSHFIDWLHQETMASFERQLEIQEQRDRGYLLVKTNPFQCRLNALNRVLNTVLAPSGWSNIRYSATARQVVAYHHQQGELPIALLSDGVRNMLGMVVDIAYRALRLNPHHINYSDLLKETDGIVLIDEVDMHLHPQWQRSILAGLQEAFPNIQFIVTTHSPLIIGELKPEHIILLSQDESNQIQAIHPAQSYGLTTNQILNEVMRDSEISSQITRNQEVEKELDNIFALIADRYFSEAEEKIKQLETELGGDIPELVKARLSIELERWDE